jgi:hypothetical protein
MIVTAFALVIGLGGASDDTWKAQAEWNPPARYDVPFPGAMHVYRMHPREVPAACGNLFARYGLNIQTGPMQRGCAAYEGNKCEIVTIDRPAYGTTPEAVLRHERGHCNGWGADHGM